MKSLKVIHKKNLTPYSKKVSKAITEAIENMLKDKARKDEKVAFEQNGKLRIVKARKVLEERRIKL